MFSGLIVLTWTLCLVITGLHHVSGHGRLVEPPSRATMWRFGFNTPPNYDDNQLFCGGVQVQYEVNGGLCGVCGDPWNGVREHEAGGKYATGTLVRKYKTGDPIIVVIELTANHKGYFQFRLCRNDDSKASITQSCLDQYLLASAMDGTTTFAVPEGDYSRTLILVYQLRLPAGVRCRACVLQWKYNAGNSWGSFENGTSCIGCGNQEQFYGCADIAVGYDNVTLGNYSSVFSYTTPIPASGATVIQNYVTDEPSDNCQKYVLGICVALSKSSINHGNIAVTAVIVTIVILKSRLHQV